MKVSKETLEQLKNFATINTNLMVKEGNQLATVANSMNILAKAVSQMKKQTRAPGRRKPRGTPSQEAAPASPPPTPATTTIMAKHRGAIVSYFGVGAALAFSAAPSLPLGRRSSSSVTLASPGSTPRSRNSNPKRSRKKRERSMRCICVNCNIKNDESPTNPGSSTI